MQQTQWLTSRNEILSKLDNQNEYGSLEYIRAHDIAGNMAKDRVMIYLEKATVF